jgi:hypothetical protein
MADELPPEAQGPLGTAEKKILEVATLDPGVEALDAVKDGRLPYVHSTVKQAAASLRQRGLLFPSRPTWVILTKKGRDWSKGHPCKRECWQSGEAEAILPGDNCPCCGQFDLIRLLSDREQAVLRLAMEHGPMPQDEFLSRVSGIPETARPGILITLREYKWLMPWNGLVPREKS